jgi:hypothetical protein
VLQKKLEPMGFEPMSISLNLCQFQRVPKIFP